MRHLVAALLLATAACRGSDAATADPVARTEAGVVVLTGRVVDRAEIISPAHEASLSRSLAALETETTDQVVIVTLPSLNGASIESVSLGLGNDWGVGRADLDNGVLLVVAPRERQVRIGVGLGLEGLLTDAKAAAIIAEMLPLFRAGEPAEAIQLGTQRIAAVLRSDKRRPQRLVSRKAA